MTSRDFAHTHARDPALSHVIARRSCPPLRKSPQHPRCCVFAAASNRKSPLRPPPPPCCPQNAVTWPTCAGLSTGTHIAYIPGPQHPLRGCRTFIYYFNIYLFFFVTFYSAVTCLSTATAFSGPADVIACSRAKLCVTILCTCVSAPLRQKRRSRRPACRENFSSTSTVASAVCARPHAVKRSHTAPYRHSRDPGRPKKTNRDCRRRSSCSPSSR